MNRTETAAQLRGRTVIRTVVGLMLVLVTTATGAASLASAAGNEAIFRSPNGIVCRYHAPDGWLQIDCQRPGGGALAVDIYGHKGHPTIYRYTPRYAGDTLQYGARFVVPRYFNCLSRQDGMLCRTPQGHGFFLGLTESETW
jgi:hypothetical protein